MRSITDIPVDIILDNLFPSIAVPDLLHLGSTSRFFSTLLNDELFWKRKLKDDFNFSGAGTARTSNWKFIYRGLTNPQVFVWGEKSKGRLGITKFPKSIVQDVPFPTKLHIPGVRIVSLVAGGMSFHALGSEGQLYVWGTLDGTAPMTLSSDGFSEPGKQASTPLKLDMPTATRGISCGRLHSTSIDANNHVWMFTSWGRPFRVVSPLVDNSSAEFTPIQVDCGWAFSSVLTKSGNVLVWWPGGRMLDQITSKNEELDREGDKKACATNDGVIPCVTWDLVIDPVRLPEIPSLPNLSGSDDEVEETRLIQIAGFDGHIVGLTNHGHVLKISVEDEITAAQSNWEYLPNFSEVEEVRKHPAFCPKEDTKSDPPLQPPQSMHITHVSAHFETFVAYSTGSSSIVLMGKLDFNGESTPTIIPALQNKSVISVVIGDYHNGALTASGKLLTWGQYSLGALGLGDPGKLDVGAPGGFETENQRREVTLSRRRFRPLPVETPTEVQFCRGIKKSQDMFCFAAAAAGWHSGALVIDLNPHVKDDDNDAEGGLAEVPEPSSSHPHTTPILPTGEPGEVPLLPRLGGGLFRIGFAGRGMNRGG